MVLMEGEESILEFKGSLCVRCDEEWNLNEKIDMYVRY